MRSIHSADLAAIAGSLQIREDDWSYQVSSRKDDRFWFRLKKSIDKDPPGGWISDFNVGGFEPSLGGDLLIACYQAIRQQPGGVIVFEDILPAARLQAVSEEEVSETYERYASYGAELLKAYGFGAVKVKRFERDGKKFLELAAEAPADAARARAIGR